MKTYKQDGEDWDNLSHVWVEEVVLIFGEIHYTQKYKSIPKRNLKKIAII
jgi:hypothetical protein